MRPEEKTFEKCNLPLISPIPLCVNNHIGCICRQLVPFGMEWASAKAATPSSRPIKHQTGPGKATFRAKKYAAARTTQQCADATQTFILTMKQIDLGPM